MLDWLISFMAFQQMSFYNAITLTGLLYVIKHNIFSKKCPAPPLPTPTPLYKQALLQFDFNC